MILKVEKLTQKAFSSFGDVLSVDTAKEIRKINQGLTQRFHDLCTIDVSREGGQPIVSIFRATPYPKELQLTIMERHPLSSQTFMPLGGLPYLVVVANRGPFKKSSLRAFLAEGCQGVNYHVGTWHHPVWALGEVQDFLVIDRGGLEDDLHEEALEGVLLQI